MMSASGQALGWWGGTRRQEADAVADERLAAARRLAEAATRGPYADDLVPLFDELADPGFVRRPVEAREAVWEAYQQAVAAYLRHCGYAAEGPGSGRERGSDA